MLNSKGTKAHHALENSQVGLEIREEVEKGIKVVSWFYRKRIRQIIKSSDKLGLDWHLTEEGLTSVYS